MTISYAPGFYRVYPSIHQPLCTGRERIQTFDPDRKLREVWTSFLFQWWGWELFGVEGRIR